MKAGWSCQKHKDEPIVFVCTGNAWHFEGLCTSCVPEHTKNHPKNMKIQIQAIKDVLEKANSIKQKVSTICQERLKQSQILAEIQCENFAYVKALNERRELLIKQINLIFDNLVQQTRKRRVDQQNNQKKGLGRLIQSLEDSIRFFQKEEYSDISAFCREIKKYYFKENLDVYVEEYDQVIKQYREKVTEYSPFSWVKDLEAKLKQFVKDLYKVEDSNDKKDKTEKIEPLPKKQTKKKEPGRRKCGKCGSEMEYLTEWKKHLVCNNCGGKERNYVKR